MPPLRFKAVCTETGREFGVDDMCCGGYVRDKKDYPIGLYWSVEFEGMALGRSNPNIELCQSTGLTDANGQEVFFGDVLRHDDTGIWEMKYHELSAAYHLYNAEADENDVSFKVRDMQVIGNRWQPATELQARAEAVSNE